MLATMQLTRRGVLSEYVKSCLQVERHNDHLVERWTDQGSSRKFTKGEPQTVQENMKTNESLSLQVIVEMQV